MPNPLFNALGGGQMPGPFGNMQQMMQRFNPKTLMQQVNQFRAQFEQNANPRAIVMNMVNKGQLSQNQLNYVQQASQSVMRQMQDVQQMMGGIK